jgi:peptidoglycan/LPS O-acetylase OafA/YrhL
MKIHFKGLNALRLYAALSVVVQHIMFSPHDWFGVDYLPDTVGRLFISGGDAVRLFFVLSGFLITYLLLVERERSQTIAVRKFYVRRVLRIWPLYFLILILAGVGLPLIVSGFVSPLANQGLTLLLILFLGNLAFVFYLPFPPLEHLWSIAVEEQFYLFIPLLARFATSLAKLFMLIIAVMWALLLLLPRLLPDSWLIDLVNISGYDTIAVGGLCAYALYHRSPILKWIYHPLPGYGAVIALVFMAVGFDPRFEMSLVYRIGAPLVFGVLILNIATNDNFFLKLSHPLLETGGNLSYSIYMIHPLLVLVFYDFFNAKLETRAYQFVAYPSIIGATLLLSWLSYRYFESPFLRLKEKFKVVSK